MEADPRLDQIRAAMRDYEEAGRLGKLAMKVTGTAPDRSARELLRLQNLGPEGRIAEGILRIVGVSQEVTRIALEHDLLEDITEKEYEQIRRYLLGREPGLRETTWPFVSVLFDTDPVHTAAISNVLPDVRHAHATDAYRYAVLPEYTEPFVIALHSKRSGGYGVSGILPAAPSFLRYEEELGVLDKSALARLDAVVQSDWQKVANAPAAIRRDLEGNV